MLKSFFYYKSFLKASGKMQHGGLILKNLEYIFDSLHIYVLFF
jgi:hypothetical protein